MIMPKHGSPSCVVSPVSMLEPSTSRRRLRANHAYHPEIARRELVEGPASCILCSRRRRIGMSCLPLPITAPPLSFGACACASNDERV